MNILVTGGTGYIGSHTVVKLIEQGFVPIIVDNLSNSNEKSIARIRQITGHNPNFYNADIRHKDSLDAIFNSHRIDAVIHFAGLKAVGESTEDPLLYYQTNIDSTLRLLEAMKSHGIMRLVFSSSATTYGSAPIPYKESYPIGREITSPYGRTKYMIEEILKDITMSDPRLDFTSLRYFNPIGAHPSGLIGENPNGTPNNLMPYITQVAIGKRRSLGIFGNDYDTIDGTGVRDYIHVDDVADGHVAALKYSLPGYSAFNLGSGKGTSVLELVKAFQDASQKEIQCNILPRRAGDLPEFYADASLAKNKLGWNTTRSIEDACRDSWKWQSMNPEGY